ncbi:hypothetical protein V2G26_008276 [Clonostachys chloroleuca]
MTPSNQLAPDALPPGFATIQQIVEGDHKTGIFINSMGVVIDVQEPRATKGSDWKSTMRIYDKSVEDNDESSLTVNIFLPQKDMPKPARGDFVVLLRLKIQKRGFGDISLLTHRESGIYLFTGSKIPRPPADASAAFSPSTSRVKRALNKVELAHIPFSYHGLDKTRIPTEFEFETRVIQSRNFKEKFSELKDLKDGTFYDLLVYIVRAYDSGDRMSLWVSDFTENQAFYHHEYKGPKTAVVQEGDPYGYQAKFSKDLPATSSWEGPFGKRSMQVTCYDSHAEAIRTSSEAGKGHWVMLKNVQVKYGQNGANLEGYLRGDRQYGESKVNMIPLNFHEDPETMDPRLYRALERKRAYERSLKAQKKQIDDAAAAGQKRKSDALAGEKPVSNAKLARREKRARQRSAQNAQNVQNAQNIQQPDTPISTQKMNPQVKCENHTKPTSSLSDILTKASADLDIDGEEVKLPMPFTNMNYRVNVRVTNFSPPDILQFAVPKKTSEYAVLEDDGDSDSSSGMDDEDMGNDSMSWEWRFALELEDSTPDIKQRERIWVVVDNQSAQCLVNLDATDLKRDVETLDLLRQRMFLLWGNLEENKHEQRQAAKKANQFRTGDPLRQTARTTRAMGATRAMLILTAKCPTCPSTVAFASMA